MDENNTQYDFLLAAFILLASTHYTNLSQYNFQVYILTRSGVTHLSIYFTKTILE